MAKLLVNLNQGPIETYPFFSTVMPSYTVGTVLSALSTAPLVALPLMITYNRSEEKDEIAKVG